MSGGEALGILGLLGLLSTCREVFDLVCEARDAGDRAQKWFGKVELQRYHFREWLRRVFSHCLSDYVHNGEYQLTVSTVRAGY